MNERGCKNGGEAMTRRSQKFVQLLRSVRVVVAAIAPTLLVLLVLVLADGTVEGATEPIMLPLAAQQAVLATEVTPV